MKYIIPFFVGLLAATSISAQSFSDDFESYKAGAWLGKNNKNWTTWGSAYDATKDVKVSSANAHSGSNSIYFSSAQTAGGPTDVILPFGGQYNTGSFVLEMQVYVSSNKVGYFNIQANSIPGVKWAMEFYFNKDASFSILNTDGSLLTGKYTQGKWVDVKLNVNLNSNTWELFFDGTSQGSFANTVDQVASMDIFAMGGSSFFIDDVSYNHTAYSLPSLNAAALNITNLAGLAGQQTRPMVTIRNMGQSDITSYDISLNYNNSTITKSISGITIGSLDTHSVWLPSSITLAPGSNIAKLTVSNINGKATDGDASDDVKSVVINPIVPAKGKIVIAEDATGTWCGYCVRSAVFLKMLSQKYAGFFQGIAVHNNDPMLDTVYDATIAKHIVVNGTTGYPTALVDRKYIIDPSGIEPDFLTRIQTPPMGVITNGAEFDKTTGILKVSLTTAFNSDISGDYRVACVIVEDSVTGTASGYDQHNYYSGGSIGPMGGFEKLSNPVPASQISYDHVARYIYPSYDGLVNSFPNSVTAGSRYNNIFSFKVGKFNSDRIKIVGMLIAPDGTIDNGSSSTISEAVNNGYISTVGAGIFTVSAEGPAINIFPNPANDMVNIRGITGKGTISVMDMTGREVLTETVRQAEIIQSLSLQSLHNGIYMIKVQTTAGISTAKVIIEK